MDHEAQSIAGLFVLVKINIQLIQLQLANEFTLRS